VDGARQQDPVAEREPRRRQEEAEGGEGEDPALGRSVERRSEERPHLPEDHRHCEEEPRVEAHRQ
jgi:hypothetical protein